MFSVIAALEERGICGYTGCLVEQKSGTNALEMQQQSVKLHLHRRYIIAKNAFCTCIDIKTILIKTSLIMTLVITLINARFLIIDFTNNCFLLLNDITCDSK